MAEKEYIEREAAIEALCCDCSATEDCRPGERCVDYMRIKSIPAADVRPVVRGFWKSVPHKRTRVCSRCETDEPYKFADDDVNVYNFCPYCGAYMMEES